MTRQSRHLKLTAVLCVLALVLAACGSGHSREDLIAATSGTPSEGANQPGVGGSGNQDTSALDELGGPDGGAGLATGGTTGGTGGTGSAGGGTGGATAGGTTGGSPAAGPQCTGREPTLNIGSVGQQSGVFGPFLQPLILGIQTWVKDVNSRGGINCHKIQFFVKDDGGDPSVHQSQVQELVEQRNVVALVGVDAPLTGNASVRYLESKGVPVIGNEGGSEWSYNSPVYFPQMITGNTALGALVAAVAKVGKPKGFTKLGILTCLEAALCSSLYGDGPGLSQKAGVQLVYRAQGSLTQPDFTSNCQAAKESGAEMFIAGLDTNSIQRILRNCQSLGYNPLYITGGPLVTPTLISDPRAEGFHVGSATALYSSTDKPGVAEFLAALKKHAPGTPPSISAIGGWTAGKLFELGMRNAAEPTRAALLASLGSIKDNDLGGLTHSLTFSAGQPAPRVACNWIGVVRGGKLVAATEDDGRFCA
jgi:branched-chain amino acid transport system substrate-binding protein